jgi:hypothetical protein
MLVHLLDVWAAVGMSMVMYCIAYVHSKWFKRHIEELLTCTFCWTSSSARAWESNNILFPFLTVRGFSSTSSGKVLMRTSSSLFHSELAVLSWFLDCFSKCFARDWKQKSICNLAIGSYPYQNWVAAMKVNKYKRCTGSIAQCLLAFYFCWLSTTTRPRLIKCTLKTVFTKIGGHLRSTVPGCFILHGRKEVGVRHWSSTVLSYSFCFHQSCILAGKLVTRSPQ